MSEPQSFVDADGIEIVYRHWPATGEPRASVVVAHGASEHSGRYARFAGALTAAGFEVFAPDHRGHGRTAGDAPAAVLGAAGFEGVAADLHHLVGIAGEAARPVLVFGHSMGSVIALRYAELHPGGIAGLALSGALGVMAGGPELLAQLQPAVDGGSADQPIDALGAFNEPFEPARTPYDWLSRDEAEVDKYLADPYCGDNHPLTYGYLHGMVGAVLEGAANVGALPPTLPVLLVAGERDPVSDGAAAVRALAGALRAAGLVDVEEIYYPDARHEVLNETNRDEVSADVVEWLSRVVEQAG